jgi:ATP-dependent helicase/nuclease subunit B
MRHGVNLATIDPAVAFLDALAAGWLAQAGDDPWQASLGLILLPTRRAARALSEAFLRQTGGRPLLLPRITAFGALDEAPLTLSGALDLPPAVDPAERLAVLSRLILALDGRAGLPTGIDRAWPLAAELARLMDEAERAEIDLEAALRDLPVGEHAAHWQTTLTFLQIVTRTWPDFLAHGGLLNPAARQVRLLHAQARAWEDAPPAHPVWVAGTTAGIPAVARLLRVVARLPQGRVVLPGVDLDMAEAAWDAIEAAHPQAGLRNLLVGLDATRGDVARWDGPGWEQGGSGRAALLGRALLPAAALGEWRIRAPVALDGLAVLRPADQQEEAVAIALALREALETPGRRAALVTPDRDLAARVAAELLRFGVVADDSAGEPLAQTPPATFLRLIAQAVAERFAPIPLLALLKHPLAAGGLAPAAFRSAARALELARLRGPRPAAGLDGMRSGLDSERAAALLDTLEACLAPLLVLAAQTAAAPADLLAGLVLAAEALAATDAEPGPARLWSGDEGEALAMLLAGLQAALPVVPDQRPETLAGLLEAALDGPRVRSRRALRGRDGAEHPRVFIWGLLEARLQAVDVVVLGGLTEAMWPPATDPGPWLSRPMRAAIALPSPEELVGQAAHDFVMTACAAPLAILSVPRRRDGAPCVPARWITRLEALLAGQDRRLTEHPAVAWARALDLPDAPRAVAPPRPCPPVALRPRKLSVTEIETWLRDPYAIYARHILSLRALAPIDEATDAADYGSIVHAALHGFLQGVGAAWPADARALLADAMDGALARAGLRPALFAWWRPRLGRIAAWVAETEADRRARQRPVALRAEVRGEYVLTAPAGPFLLTGRADRIERRADGTLAILDYKTGQPPGQADIDRGLAPQLPLEAVMAAAAGFGPELAGEAAELTYWHLSGGFSPGDVMQVSKGDAAAIAALVATARDKLAELVAAYDDPARTYLSQPHPGFAPRFSDYAQLARVGEWGATEAPE